MLAAGAKQEEAQTRMLDVSMRSLKPRIAEQGQLLAQGPLDAAGGRWDPRQASAAQRCEPSLAAVPPPALVRAVFPYRETSESLYRTGRELFLPYEVRSAQSLQHLLSMLPWETLVALA